MKCPKCGHQWASQRKPKTAKRVPGPTIFGGRYTPLATAAERHAWMRVEYEKTFAPDPVFEAGRAQIAKEIAEQRTRR